MTRIFLYIILLLLLPVTLVAQENKEVNYPDYLLLRELAVNIYSADLDTDKQKKAVETIREMGPSILPELIRLSKDPDKNVRAGAILALGIFPREAKRSVPVLIHVINEKDEELTVVAADTVREIGSEAAAAVPHLINVIKDTRFRKSGSSAIFYAVAALGEIGPAAKAAIPTLKGISNDRRVSSATQAEASIAIALIERKNPDPKVRANAARCLGGTGRASVIPILKELLNDPDESVRKAADEALIFMRVGALLDKVQGKDTIERLNALRALGDMGQAAKWGELIISHCLTDSNEQIRRAAAETLRKIKGK